MKSLAPIEITIVGVRNWVVMLGLASASIAVTACFAEGPPPVLTDSSRHVVSVAFFAQDNLPYGAPPEVYEQALHERCTSACDPAKKPGEKLVHCKKLDESVLDETMRLRMHQRSEVYLCGFGGAS